VLDTVAITERADEPVRALSRGLLQRVACARVCLHRPALLLLDEPWANLDVAATAHLRDVLGRETGPTRVLVTHDIAHALSEADTVIGLRAGRQVLLADASAPVDLGEVFA
jgi:ABC-type nitrate/sulfonate/bicarbonate transport system ATPase subunit